MMCICQSGNKCFTTSDWFHHCQETEHTEYTISFPLPDILERLLFGLDWSSCDVSRWSSTSSSDTAELSIASSATSLISALPQSVWVAIYPDRRKITMFASALSVGLMMIVFYIHKHAHNSCMLQCQCYRILYPSNASGTKWAHKHAQKQYIAPVSFSPVGSKVFILFPINNLQ